jgi:2'-hydroxyisoflavone reductase
MKITRRTALAIGAGAAAGTLLPGAAMARRERTLLILGGTGFIGPHLTREAVRRGWKVTHFNRGHHGEDVPAGVESLIGDRNGKFDALRGRHWDAVVDNNGYVPKQVKMSAELLAPAAGYCLYVSSISAYASFDKPNDEHSPTGVQKDIDAEQVTNDSYGPMKALCEQYVMAAFKGRASVVRPGYIVGPLDPTDRFTWWPVRYAQGGEMLAPGTPADPVQVIDVRDLTTWMMRLVEHRTLGYYNAISAPRQFTTADIIAACRKAAPDAATTVTLVPEDFLAAHWKAEDMDLPPWSPMHGEEAGASLTASAAAQRTGLAIRSLDETVRDTLGWFRSLPAERQAKLRAGLDPQLEKDTLAQWHAAGH